MQLVARASVAVMVARWFLCEHNGKHQNANLIRSQTLRFGVVGGERRQWQ